MPPMVMQEHIRAALRGRLAASEGRDARARRTVCEVYREVLCREGAAPCGLRGHAAE
jgi:hypothetical protein